MTVLSYYFVDYKLDDMEDDITRQSIQMLASGQQTYIDGDEIIDSDDMLTVLATGFGIIGFIITLCMVAIIIVISRRSQLRIKTIEHVLLTAAEGDLSARTGVKYQSDDLARISATVDMMLSRLQATVDAMTDISANIAHELKTPISRLQYQLQTIEQLMPEGHGEHSLPALHKAIDESQRISATFDALLRISQIESGARRSRFSPVSVSAILETLTDIYQDVADDNNIKFHYQASSDACQVLGDKELLLQLFANLVENAIRYCPSGSEIVIHCAAKTSARSANGHHDRHNQHSNDCIVVSVADNGPGIEESQRSRVFERLYRLDKSRTDSGLGLGLSLVKAITQLHSGHIELQDNHPGLKVELQLPALIKSTSIKS